MKKRSLLLVGVILVLILIDGILKYLVVVNGFEYTLNQGIGLGLFTGSGLILSLAGLLIALFLTPGLFKNNTRITDLILVFIWAGGIANLIDRFIYGGVLDYLNFFGISVFNFADILITSAVILIIYQFFLKSKNYA